MENVTAKKKRGGDRMEKKKKKYKRKVKKKMKSNNYSNREVTTRDRNYLWKKLFEYLCDYL